MGFEPTTPTLASVGTTGQTLLFRALSVRNGAEHFENTLQLRAYSAPRFLMAADGICSTSQPVGMVVAVRCH
jgi:hypothetical protein